MIAVTARVTIIKIYTMYVSYVLLLINNLHSVQLRKMYEEIKCLMEV